MADAHYLSDKDGKKFYPYAHASATYDNNGNTVEKRLKALDETASSAVQSVKIGTTEYKSGTTVTLPSYPTSLPASDVPSWAKQKTKPSYNASEIGLGNVGNFKAVSTVANQGLTDTEKSNARANIGAQVAGSYASSTHNHDDKYQAKGSYASASHTHDDRYYTETEINTKLNGKANSSHTHGNGDITSLDASKITSGTISIDRLPQGALERLTVVADDTARFKLTSTSVQKGDTVKVTSTGKMYYVVDETKLSTEAGYEVYAAGTAASVPWNGVTGKPSTYTPSSHTHNYAGSSSAGGSANSLSYFQNTSSTNVGQAEGGSNAIAYISDYSGTALTSGVKDGALYRQAYSTSWVHQIYGDYRTGQIAVRGKNNGAWQNWRRVLDESNYKKFCTPANIGAAAANHSHSNYLTGINKSMVTSALGYTPPRVIIQSSEPAISTNDEWLLEY